LKGQSFDHVELAHAAAENRVSEWLASVHVAIVHLALLDSSGTLREKRLGTRAAARAFEDGWSFIDAIQWWGPDDVVTRQGGSEHQPAVVDLQSGRLNPFEANSALFLADFEGPLAELSPRRKLQSMVDRLADAGLAAELGWEFECIVLDRPTDGSLGEAGELRPTLPDNRCWSSQTMVSQGEVIGGLVNALEAGGIPIDHVCAELGPGCLELALEQQPALHSADHAAWMKIFTKAYFDQRGSVATFMAQLSDGFPGLGGHPSLSLRSTLDGSPALAGSDGALSKTALAAIAGITALLPELLVLAAPNPNSYRRYGPGNWAPSTASWGIGNYSCALRVVADQPESTRLELRIPGADTSPHLCATMLLAAAIWGIEHGLEPPPPVQAPVDGRHQHDGPRLPRNLVEAAELFSASTAARALCGSSFVDHYAASRIAEAQACARFVSAEERRRYLRHV
jgi:glutamine synthetase